MMLEFSTHWPDRMPKHMAGHPTYFSEKILETLLRDKFIKVPKADWSKYLIGTPASNYIIGSKQGKLHTIRRDKLKQWKKGMDIHFVINHFSPQRFQFAPVIKCTGTQKLEIRYTDPDGYKYAEPRVYIDGLWITNVEQLATNDGFDSVADFFAWFRKDFTGKIIHWTDFRY